jgi:hypothetical protein
MTDARNEFTPFERTSPFFDLIGPLLCRRDDDGMRFGLSIDERHVNARGFTHGGVLATLADVALGYTAALQKDPPARLITASLTIDFAGTVTPASSWSPPSTSRASEAEWPSPTATSPPRTAASPERAPSSRTRAEPRQLPAGLSKWH